MKADTQMPPAPSHKIPVLPSAKNFCPAKGATIPAIRPRQDNIPLALARYVVLNISGADAYRTALKYYKY
jgi:hypothetical protein